MMTTLKSFKTPLRYAGGKSRACKKLDKYFPDLSNYKEFREPFIGGGSVALHITKNNPHLKIWVNDLNEPLVNFWQVLKMHGEDLTDQLLNEKFFCKRGRLSTRHYTRYLSQLCFINYISFFI